MSDLPKTLFVRSDIKNPEYQEALKELLEESFKGQQIKRTTYKHKEDNGQKVQNLIDISSKLGFGEPFKIFDFNSHMCEQFRISEEGKKYKSLTLDYD